MYGLNIKNVININPYEELIKLFLTPDEYRIYTDENQLVPEDAAVFNFEGDKDQLKRQLYQYLSVVTGKQPKWGILTGIRPVKLAGELCRQQGSRNAAEKHLTEEYLISREKTQLILDLYQYQQDKLGMPDKNTAGIYIGIPFCPTRCLYCSFTSNQSSPEEMQHYLEALFSEIRFVGQGMQRDGIFPESIYIGGGTPTSLSPQQLQQLMSHIKESFDLSRVKEFTVEAGRPDTITPEKLDVLNQFQVDRISINPQTMHQKTLDTIGRDHTVQETRKAFAMAHDAGIPVINADLIAGLPGETEKDFQESLKEVLELGAHNITLHTLAVKRSSRLKEMDENFHYRHPQLTENMLSGAKDILTAKGYRPYYLYRQKHTAGNTENIGYCKNDSLSLYNVRIMEEAQSIIALGAGGISKVYYPQENRLERIPNVSNYEIYIERIDEMLERKRNHLFRR